LTDGTFYLTNVDDKYRRSYQVKNGSFKITNPLKPNQTAMKRLSHLDGHVTAGSTGIDSSVMKQVTVNFHKKPIQE
jgi:hypothetical protein